MGNVLLAGKACRVVNIDANLVPLNATERPREQRAYLDRVRSLLLALRDAGSTCEAVPFRRACDAITARVRYRVPTPAVCEMQRGAVALFRRLQQLRADDLHADMAAWRDALAALEPPLVGLASVDVPFVASVVDTVRAVAL